MSIVAGVLVDGLIYASWLFLISAGLTLIYGVMKIVNMAHGSFYAIGAYAGVATLGLWFQQGYPAAGSIFVLLAAAGAAGIALGLVVERGILRPFRGSDPIVLLLVTYALFLGLEDGIKLVFGVDPYLVSEPLGQFGTLKVGGVTYPAYNFLIVLAAVIAGGGLTWFLQYTPRGKLVRAVIHDPEIAQAMGVNVEQSNLWAFAAGTALAAIGGALTGPTVAVSPGMATEVIVLMFAVVVIGGLGSIPGTIAGAVVVGLVRSFTVRFWPEVELFGIYAVMAFVLAVRPKGLFAPVEPRRI